ncbi:MAG: hypothetical protein LBS31_01125, partial [Candidatus Adiutrix sp.]|nr:hypothetical protein [Candidatus Adiutrix sp.]
MKNADEHGPARLDEPREKIKKLRDEIKKHNELYYVRNAPEISDDQWDELFRELKNLEELYPELAAPDSPTRTVG